MYPVMCSAGWKETSVPFQPSLDKLGNGRDCFQPRSRYPVK
ncbi:hypothetical protein [Heliobacterium mobile]